MYDRSASLGTELFTAAMPTTPRTPRNAERAYITERLHLAVGQADILLFSDFQKLISC